MLDLSTRIKEYLMQEGASLVGIGDLGGLAPAHRRGMGFGISIAVAVSPSVIGDNFLGPTKEFHTAYKRIMEDKLPNVAHKCCRLLSECGYRSAVLPVAGGADPATLRTPLSHKMIATRSGLGWIGKNGLLVTKEYGSAIMLISVLTDALLTPGEPIDATECGDCLVCVRACPGGALKGNRWCLGTDRDDLLDAHQARQTARQRALHSLDVEETVCGICIAVCPWTRGYVSRVARA